MPLGNRHGVVIDSSLKVRGLKIVWALGICAEIPNDLDDKTYGPKAQNAIREDTHLANNIALVMKGKKPRPFHYKMLGKLAFIADIAQL